MTRANDMALWGAGSAFKDGTGALRTWYHGTTCPDAFNVFARCDEGSVGYHFGCAAVASARVEDMTGSGNEESEAPLVVPVVCRAEAPLRLDDLFCWGPGDCIAALEIAQVISAEEADDLRDDVFELATMYAYLEEAGYDSIVYANVTESRMDHDGSDSLIVWRAELLKSPFSLTFSRADPRLLSQNETSSEDLRDWQGLRNEIGREREAIAQRRMALAARMDRADPMPQPSFA